SAVLDNGIYIRSSGNQNHADILSPSKLELMEAQTWLQQSNAMTENFYSLHREGSILFVVVEEGFSLKLEDNVNKLQFLKAYMKKLCEIVPVHQLAQDPLHIQYVSLVTS
ncbi:hypothetical protein ACPF8X_45925, partial [Streptomyces sp. G35A]